MDYNSNFPTVMLPPHLQRNSNSSSLGNYGNTPKSLPASLAGGKPNSSFFSYVATSAVPSGPRISNNGTVNKTFAQPRPPSVAYGSARQHPQPKHNPNLNYNFGPESTSHSIAASATSSRNVSGSSSMQRSANPHGQSNYSYCSFESNQNYDNSLAVQTKPSIPIMYHDKIRNPYRRQPEGQPKLRAITAPGLVPDEAKFIQSAGLKVRSNLKSNLKSEPKVPKSKVYHTRTSSLNKLPAPPDTPIPSSSRLSKASHVDTGAGSAECSNQIKPRIFSPLKGPAEVKSDPNMFYSSLLASKPFSLSLSSSARHKAMGSQTHMEETEEQLCEIKDLARTAAEQEKTIENLKDGSNKLDTQMTVELTEPQSVVELQVQQARSDRKMEDLQISNTSLRAVNKYLEKQLRTQSKDIQILKRLGGTLPEITNSETEDDDDEIDEKKDKAQLLGKDLLLPLSKAEHDLAEKTKMIENRMQSHINFLESSEKVNQMMRNCILITDTLLEAALNSLEYKIDTIDVDNTASNTDLTSGSNTNGSGSEPVKDFITPKNSPRNHRRKKSSLDLSHALLDGLAEEYQSDLDKLVHAENESTIIGAHTILSRVSAYRPK